MNRPGNIRFQPAVFSLVLSIAAWPSLSFAIPEYIWQHRGGGEFSDVARAVTTDNAGNVIISGNISNSTRFDGIAVTGRSVDVVVAKYNSDGVVQWVQPAGSPHSNEVGRDITTDNSGTIYVTGQFENEADFGTTRLSSAGQSDIFVAKYSASGDVIWARRAGGRMGPDRILGTPDAGRGIAVDRIGNTFVTGHFRDRADFSGTTLISAGESDLFLAKYSPGGDLMWAVDAGGSGTDFGNSVAIDAVGNVYIAGQIEGMASFGRRNVIGSGRDLFVAKYLSSGSLVWVKRVPVSEGGVIHKIRNSPDDNLFITGGFAGTINLDSLRLHSRDYPGMPHTDMFVAKLNIDGDFQWARSGGGNRNDYGNDIGFERSGNIFVVGNFEGEFSLAAEFDGIRLNGGVGDSELFLAEYRPDGYLLEIDKLDTQVPHFSTGGISLGSNRDDQIYLAGTFERISTAAGDSWFGGIGDIFVSKLRVRPRPPEADLCETGVDSIGRPCVLSPWQHIHWRCTRDVRRALGEPDLLCPGVFENGFAPRGAEEAWFIERPDMALESETAEDYFSVLLPDPTSAMESGHPDIRSSEDILAGGDPEPMLECGAVRREEAGIVGRDNRIYVSITGMLNIRVEPQINSRSRRELTETGESIHIYRGSTRDDSLATGDALSKTIICPGSDPAEVRAGKGLSEVRFSVGERSGPRESSATGGYRLDVEYIIKSVRGIPRWVLDHADERNAGAILPLPCTRGLGGFGSANFPFCVGDLDQLIRNVPLPFDRQNNCIADGPGCWGVFSFQWPHDKLALSMAFFDAANMNFELFDVDENLVASSVAHSQSGNLARSLLIPAVHAHQEPGATSTLEVDSLPKGQYFLIVNGAPGSFSIQYTLPEPDRQSSAEKWYLAFLSLVILLLFFGYWFARKSG